MKKITNNPAMIFQSFLNHVIIGFSIEICFFCGFCSEGSSFWVLILSDRLRVLLYFCSPGISSPVFFLNKPHYFFYSMTYQCIRYSKNLSNIISYTYLFWYIYKYLIKIFPLVFAQAI